MNGCYATAGRPWLVAQFPAPLKGRCTWTHLPYETAFAAARPAARPEKMQPPRKVPSKER